MNREIKFRGMGIKGNWYFGNLAIIIQRIGIAMEGSYISNEVGSPFAYFVRPETVGQYTGLKDKNGKEIYEGDIVRKDVFKLSEVIFINGGFGIKDSIYFLSAFQSKIEVIGNIYENPDLLTIKN